TSVHGSEPPGLGYRTDVGGDSIVTLLSLDFLQGDQGRPGRITEVLPFDVSRRLADDYWFSVFTIFTVFAIGTLDVFQGNQILPSFIFSPPSDVVILNSKFNFLTIFPVLAFDVFQRNQILPGFEFPSPSNIVILNSKFDFLTVLTIFALRSRGTWRTHRPGRARGTRTSSVSSGTTRPLGSRWTLRKTKLHSVKIELLH